MNIDLRQLPIPDWGLECPGCRYLLVGLMSHRCPECGLQFDMTEVVKPWHRLRDPLFDGREDPLPDYGVECDACRRPLAGARRGGCPNCDVAYDLQKRLPKREWFLIDRHMCGDVTIAALQPLMNAEYIPCMEVAGKTLTEIYGVSNQLDIRLSAPREFYFDVLHLIRATQIKMKEARASSSGAWRCAGCGTRVPANFEVCWSCQTPRDKPN